MWEEGASATLLRPMKVKIRNSARKRSKMVGFRTRSKTVGGRRIIKRRIKKQGTFRV